MHDLHPVYIISLPEPFHVINCKQDMFYTWNNHLSQFFAKNFPFPTRPIRVLNITKEVVGKFVHKDSFSGKPIIQKTMLIITIKFFCSTIFHRTFN